MAHHNHTTLALVVILVCLSLGLSARGAGATGTGPSEASPLAGSRQLLLVVTENWDTNTGTLLRFERDPNGPWRPVGESFAVSVGRNGLAWGRGLNVPPVGAGPVKAEGDGRAPAGVFTLPGAFAYAPKELATPPRLTVYPITEHSVCVDTTTSRLYNRTLEETAAPAKDWDSEERMLRPDGLYRYGLFVEHNTPDTKPGAGSCIFLHLWRAPGAPTSGCTAMAQADMLTLLAWLDAAQKPLLVQLPRQELAGQAAAWGAPELAKTK